MTPGVRRQVYRAAAGVNPRTRGGSQGWPARRSPDADAVGWVTHFLNASYYGASRPARDLQNARTAWTVLTTYWHQLGGGQLEFGTCGDSITASAAPAHPRAASTHADWSTATSWRAAPVSCSGPGSKPRSGSWTFGLGVALRPPGTELTYEPEVRLRAAALGALSPPRAPLAEQTWHTYEPVPIPGVDDLVAVLEAADMWSHYATDIGRFTALRPGPLEGQTFEIEAIAELARHAPMRTRGYVTVTKVLDRSRPDALRERLAAVSKNLA